MVLSVKMITIVIPFVSKEKTKKTLSHLELINQSIPTDLILVEAESFSYEVCDLADSYGCFHLVVSDLSSKRMYEAIESLWRGNVVAFLDGDVTPEPGWIEQAYNTHIKYPDCKFVGGPINIKTKSLDLSEVAKRKWPIQMVNKTRLFNCGFIKTNYPIQYIASSNISVKTKDYWKLNKENVRIGKIGYSESIGNDCYHIDDEFSIFNERMIVTYQA